MENRLIIDTQEVSSIELVEAARREAIKKHLAQDFRLAVVLRFPRKSASAPHITASADYTDNYNDYDGYNSHEDRKLAITARRQLAKLKQAHTEVVPLMASRELAKERNLEGEEHVTAFMVRG